MFLILYSELHETIYSRVGIQTMKLDGKWTPTEAQLSGDLLPADIFSSMTLSVAGDKYIITLGSEPMQVAEPECVRPDSDQTKKDIHVAVSRLDHEREHDRCGSHRNDPARHDDAAEEFDPRHFLFQGKSEARISESLRYLARWIRCRRSPKIHTYISNDKVWLTLRTRNNGLTG